jgi:urease accessory protein UreE
VTDAASHRRGATETGPCSPWRDEDVIVETPLEASLARRSRIRLARRAREEVALTLASALGREKRVNMPLSPSIATRGT